MGHFNKIIAVVLAILTLLFVMIGCGPEATETQETTVADETTQMPQTEKPVDKTTEKDESTQAPQTEKPVDETTEKDESTEAPQTEKPVDETTEKDESTQAPQTEKPVEETTEEDESTQETPPDEDVIDGKLHVSVMTFNIRLQTKNDTGVRSWNSRRDAVKAFILNQNADIICMQEVKAVQKAFFVRHLAPKYETIWYGRTTGDVNDEGLAIAYNQEKWTLIEKGRFWLSPTPDVASIGWNAAHNRICVTAVLEHKATGERIHVFNVHLDHQSAEARKNGIALVLERILQSPNPAYLCGDFNCKYGSDAYQKASAVMNDSCKTSPVTESGCTFNNWGANADDAADPIDFNFFSKDRIETLTYQICRDRWGENNQNCLSDHYAVKSTIALLCEPTE